MRSKIKLRNKKLGQGTIILIEEKREMITFSSEYAALNKTVRRKIREDVRQHNIQLIEEVVERNKLTEDLLTAERIR